MRVRTDDEVYRVDAVWLGPPKATFPWRVRYVGWGIDILVFFVTLSVEHVIGFHFGFFPAAWALVITIAVTRFVTRRITHERPLSAVFAMWLGELQSPREKTTAIGGAASATRIRVRAQRPRPKVSAGRRAATRRAASQQATVPGRAVAAPNTAEGVNGRLVGQPERRQLSWEQVPPPGPRNWDRSGQQAIWMAAQPPRQPVTGSPRAGARHKRRRGRSARR